MKVKNLFRAAVSIFQERPIAFSLAFVLTLLSLATGSYVAALSIVALTIAEIRIVIMRSKMRVLGIIAGAAVVAAVGGMFNE